MRLTRRASTLGSLLIVACGPTERTSDTGGFAPDARDPDVGFVDISTPDASTPGEDDWVAFVRVRTSQLERVVMARADGSGNEIELPVDTSLTVAKFPDFAPDGSALVYTYATTDETSLRIFDLADSRVEDHLLGDFAALQSPDWSPDGSQIAFRAKRAQDDPWSTWVWTLSDDTVREVVPTETEPAVVSALAWSCDGTSFFHIRGTAGPAGQTDLWEMGLDGDDADQITFGRNPTNLLVSVNPDCHEVVVDSLAIGGALRIGVSQAPPDGSLGRGFVTPLGLDGSDSNCVYSPGGGFTCERLSGPPPTHAPCDSGSSQCVLDIVTIAPRDGATLSNATTSLDARETFPTVTTVPESFESE